MRLLVTNDDGIASPGIHILAEHLLDAGHEVVVAAPAHDCSGQGAALGPLHLTGKVTFERVDVDGAEVFAVDGPPALIVLAARLGGFGAPPDMVVSGINAGANTGRAVLHSGTVGAALTAANYGTPALAVSQAVGDRHQWSTAAAVATAFLPAARELTGRTVLNINVPNVALGDVQGVTPAALDPGGTVQAAMVETESGVLELRIPEQRPPEEDTDTALLERGFVTVSCVTVPGATGHYLQHACRQVESAIFESARRVPA